MINEDDFTPEQLDQIAAFASQLLEEAAGKIIPRPVTKSACALAGTIKIIFKQKLRFYA